MATVTINEKEIIVEDGTLILNAARDAGYNIPTFCYQADLAGIGSCRMCLVEIDGQRKLQPSCVTPVLHGMKIFTDSPAVTSARASMLEFLLANHALDCPVCDKGGECELQDMVYEYGPRNGRYGETKNRFHEKDYILSPVIVKNSNRCVQCMKCVRVCDEVVGVNVLGAIGRGEQQEPTSFFREELDCDHCGNCIEVCPVGCFMRLPYRYKTRAWNLKGADTICPYCATGCRMVVEERDGTVVRARAQLGVGLNSETLCARGRFGYDIVNSDGRLTTPLVRRSGSLEPASWEEALGVIKDNLKTADPSRVGGVSSARLTNEELYLFQKLLRGVLRSPNIDGSRWSPSAVKGFVSATGMNEGGVSVFDCMEADSVLVIGSHLSSENPVTDYIVRRISAIRGTKLAIVSPRPMKLDTSASLSLRHLPGTEKEVLDAVSSYIGGKNAEKLGGHAGLGSIRGVGAEALFSAAGVDAAGIEALAKTLNGAATVSIIAGTEFLRFPRGAEGLALLIDILRSLGKKVLVMPALDRCNQRGAWEMGLHPGFGPAYTAVSEAGLCYDDMLKAASAGELDCLYVVGDDPVSEHRDKAFVTGALSKLKFLVVQEIFLTDTAKLADVVLPGAAAIEKEGTFTNQEGRVQAIKRLMPPPGIAKSDIEILAAVGRLFDPSFAPDARGSASILDEIRQEAGMYEEVSLAFNNKRNINDKLDNKEALVKGSGVALGVEHLEVAPITAADEAGSFILTTGNHLFHSGRLSGRSKILRGLLKDPVVEISSADASALGLASGDKVRVKSDSCEAELLLATKSGSKNGVAFIAENFTDLPVNRFFGSGSFAARVSITRA
jgi:NADH-quinone oxidoreductase subunit G